MSKQRPLTPTQRKLMDVFVTDSWRSVPHWARHAAITGLVKRGLIEWRESSVSDWITDGQIRKAVPDATPGRESETQSITAP